MKKKILALFTAAATCLSLAACSANTNSGSTSSGGAADSAAENSSAASSAPAAGGATVDLRVWGAEEDQKLLTELVDKFKAKYSDTNFNIQIGVESEATAKDTILTDVSAAADVFAFANDQLNGLVAANALANLNELNDVFQNISGQSIDDIKAKNMDSVVAAATKNDTLYALPLGAGNNYFLFYDKTKIKDSDVETWDGLLEAAGNAGNKVGHVLNSGWYNGGWFLGAGFKVSTNEDGTTNCDWNGTSADGISGVEVTQAMLKVAAHPAFMAINDGDISNQIAAGSLCAVISGSWDMSACEAAWGAENVGMSKLPTYTVGDKQVQQGCFSGFKLMGVNAMSKQVGWAAVLADYLTDEEAQTMRFEARQLAPTNIKASEADAVKSNAMISASLAQDAACGVIQDVGDKYWEPMKTFGAIIATQGLDPNDTAAIQEALDTMVAGVTSAIT